MIIKKRVPYVYALIIVFWMIVALLFKMTVLEVINVTFISGVIGFLIVATMLIVQSGFTTLFISGFRKIGVGLSGNSHAMERVDEQVKNDQFMQEFKRSIKERIQGIVLSFSIVSTSISMLGLIFYYYY